MVENKFVYLQQLGKVNSLRLYKIVSVNAVRLITNIQILQIRHKRIKHMNSFIITRLQRKLRKSFENPLSVSPRFSGPTYAKGLESLVPPLGFLGRGPHF